MKIAVTGGIGSGKSTLCRLLKTKNFPVFSCDEIYLSLCSEPEFLGELNAHFQGCVKNGALDRAYLSQLVFHSEAARQELNALSHPKIMARLFEKMQHHALAFAEVPLLFECGTSNLFDKVFVVLREKKQRIHSVMLRSGLSAEEISLRMARQFAYPITPSSYPKNCILLQNNGSVQDLDAALQNTLHTLGISAS